MDREFLKLQKKFALACRILADHISITLPDCDKGKEECMNMEQWEIWKRYIEETVEKEPVCRVCGCTQNNACPNGCWWVEEDLCSHCAEA